MPGIWPAKARGRPADLIRAELGQDKAQVAAIGLAGENRVYTASITHSDASAAEAASGAIMGDKRLKAIAIRGTKDIYVAKPAELFARCPWRREKRSCPGTKKPRRWPGREVVRRVYPGMAKHRAATR